MSAKTRMAELTELVRYHSDLYYNKAEPEVTDAEYDAMVSELKDLVEQGGDQDELAEAKEALAAVGSAPSYGRKVVHSAVMGSLDKETTPEAIVEWAKRHSAPGAMVTVTPKVDGTALRINYLNGKLAEAATRGDGTVGQDITDNARAMKSVPKVLKCGLTLEVRGEGYMRKSVFERLAASGERVFANPRNAAAGSIMAKDPEVTGRRDIDVLVYDVKGDCVPRFKTEQEKREWMEENLPEFELVAMASTIPQLFAAMVAEWEKDRPGLDFLIDGLVVALESMDDQEEAGWNGKRPRGKMAYKFAPEQQKARVLKVDWQVGRTGRLTPLARIEPTKVDGSTISNLTLHNANNVKVLDVADGDEVLIEKAGDIIPQVVRVTDRKGRTVSAGSFVYPARCPVCDEPVSYDAGHVNLWCYNPACAARLEGNVLHYIKTLDILGVGEGIVSALCKAGYVKSVPDLYFLTLEQLEDVTGGKRAAEKAQKAILEKNQVPLAVFLDSLGIDGLGTTTSKDVAKEFKTLDAVKGLAAQTGPGQEPGIEWLTKIGGIGRPTAVKICTGLAQMAPVVERLVKCVDVLDVVGVTGPLTGKSFCLTGAMSKPRKDIEAAIVAAGGEARSSVAKGLTYLVQADASSTSNKTEKAKKLGTQVIGEDELWTMMAGRKGQA